MESPSPWQRLRALCVGFNNPLWGIPGCHNLASSEGRAYQVRCFDFLAIEVKDDSTHWSGCWWNLYGRGLL